MDGVLVFPVWEGWPAREVFAPTLTELVPWPSWEVFAPTLTLVSQAGLGAFGAACLISCP